MLRFGAHSIASPSVDDISNPHLKRLYLDWTLFNTASGLPKKSSFVDPVRLKYLLGNLMIYRAHWIHGRALFKYELFGTNIAHQRGFDLTGTWVHEHPYSEVGKVAQQEASYVR